MRTTADSISEKRLVRSVGKRAKAMLAMQMPPWRRKAAKKSEPPKAC